MMKFVTFLLSCVLAGPAFAQVDCNAGMEPIDRSADFPLTARDYIKVVTAKEQQFTKALGSFGYAIDIKVETVQGDTVDGEFRRASVLGFDAAGARKETAAEGATNTLTRLKLSDKAIAALGNPASFTFDAESFANRDIVYSGRQKMDDHNLAIFDVLPRSDRPLGHAFEGRTWVRGRDRAILKSCGRSADFPMAMLRFVSLRDQVAETNYFPVLVRADEDLQVDGAPVHVRVTVKFSNYRAKP